ncbi:MAG: YihY/virulence factor BrkB family protein [Variovorax sp.]|nr:YihY/virulence factor BrkB family protein [Variovorax sp.]
MTLKHLYDLCRNAVTAWVDDYAPSMGAAISYYTIFSLAPLLVIVIAVAGAVFGREAAQQQIVAQIAGLVGRDGAMAVEALLRSASDTDRGIVAGAISAVVLLVGATTVFAELQSALDRIWHVPDKQKPSGIWSVLRARVLSFGLVLGLAFLLVVSLMISAGLAAFDAWFGRLMPGWEALLQGLNEVFSVGIFTLLFAMIFKLMPTARIRWSDVWVGALVTALLFELGKFGIGLYLGKSGFMQSFAAAGSLVVLVAWVYYAAQIFLLGAEFTKVYADEHGSLVGAKAQADTKLAAKVAENGPGVALTALSAAQDTAADARSLADTAHARRAIEKRIERSTNVLVRQLIILGVVTAANVVLERWRRRQMKAHRRAAARRS